MNWVLQPFWSVRIIAMIGLVLLALTVTRWRREKRGGKLAILRGLAWLSVLGVMLNPQQLLPRLRAEKPRLIVLVDTSESMGRVDPGEPSRLERAVNVLGETKTLARLNREFELDIRAFAREARPAELAALKTNAPKGDATDIATALISAVSQLGDAVSQAGVLLVSDGRATTVDTVGAAELALARSVPIWTWTIGATVPRHDLWIETAASEVLAFSGAEVELAASLRVEGYTHRSFRVELMKDGAVLESRDVIPAANGTARVAMKVRAPETGEARYLFRVPVETEEADTLNNDRAVFVRSVGEKVRVLIAEGQPHWDTKFLVQSLKQDPKVELTAVYRLSATRHVAVVSATGSETRVEEDLFPRTKEAIEAFDVIMLGRGVEAFFDDRTESMLTEFVSSAGGSLVFARGKPYGGRFQPLAKFEPVAWGSGVATEVTFHPTEAGRDHPIFDLGAAGTLEELLERLPALDQASATLGEKPLAVVLASAASREGPVLVAYQRYGHGKALCLNAGGLWRWSFRESGQEESEAAYRRFWVSLMQWLLSGSQYLPGSDVALRSTRRYYHSDQPMQFLIATRNLDRSMYQPKLLITGTGGRVEIEPRERGDVFVAEAGPFPPGTYQVTLKNNVGMPPEIDQSVEVVPASLETRELSADPALMRQLAEASGGATVDAGDIARLPEVVRQWEEARQLAHRQRPIWDRWWVLAAMLALLGGEWWLRRHEGLL